MPAKEGVATEGRRINVKLIPCIYEIKTESDATHIVYSSSMAMHVQELHG